MVLVYRSDRDRQLNEVKMFVSFSIFWQGISPTTYRRSLPLIRGEKLRTNSANIEIYFGLLLIVAITFLDHNH